MDRQWSQRSMPYKACLASLIIGIFPFLMGFGAPDWMWFRRKGDNGTILEGSFGLWEVCLESESECSSNSIFGNIIVDDWFLAVVILETLALPFYLMSLTMALFQNFCQRRWIQTLRVRKLRELLHKDSEIPEDLAFISGFLSCQGIIVFMIMTSDVVFDGAIYSWGFAMTFTGASICVIIGVAMCKAHSPSFGPREGPTEPQVVQTLSPRVSRNSSRRLSGRQSRRRSERNSIERARQTRSASRGRRSERSDRSNSRRRLQASSSSRDRRFVMQMQEHNTHLNL